MPIYRKWMRLSLRWALLITTIICLWLGWQTHIDRRRARALAQIRELGGNVQADAVQASFFVRLVNKNGSLDAVRVSDVNFLGPIVSDSDIDDIARCASVLPNLESITLMETAVTPVGERKLRAKLPNL